MAKRKPHQKKDGPTPPAPQNQMKRATHFFKTKEDPHSQSELHKIARTRAENEWSQRKITKKQIPARINQLTKPTQGSEMEKIH